MKQRTPAHHRSVGSSTSTANLHQPAASGFSTQPRGERSLVLRTVLAPVVIIALLFYLFTTQQAVTRSAASSQETYKHTNSQIHKRFGQCTDDQMNDINQQLGLDKTCNAHWFECGICSETKCPVSSWIQDFYLEDEGINEDSSSFLGVSIGCNKGYDAISTARMGMSNVEFDKNTWQSALGINNEGICKQKNAGQPNISKPARQGEMHCVEPMPSTFERLSSAVSALDLESKGFVVTHAAVSASDGSIRFPSGSQGKEDVGMDFCLKRPGSKRCVDVPMYSLQSYVERFVKSKGPINILQIDVEGFDFDVLFGAGSVLDRTQYLEFEFHAVASWGNLHMTDAVRLLDAKGFTCYWSGIKKLWRITDCYFDFYNGWHGWSNVACVHRSQTNLADAMEKSFLNTLKA